MSPSKHFCPATFSIPAHSGPAEIDHLLMRRGLWAADMSVLRAASVRGVIRARQLVDMGVPERTVYARCRDGGPWQRLLPGIILLSNGPPTTEQLLTAGLLHAGPGAMITGLHACRRQGVRRGPLPSPALVHLLVDHRKQPNSSGFAVVERTIRLPAPTMVDGLPMAPVARACMDAARRIRARGDVTELLADAVQHGLCSVQDLVTELGEGTRRGTGTPRSVLAEVSEGVRSAAEDRAKQLWPSTGLPDPWWNASVYNAKGEMLGIADCWLDDVAMVWEIESTAWHLDPASHDRSIAKAARFAAHGALYLPIKPRMLYDDRLGVVRLLQEAYKQAAARPRPPLRALRESPGR